MASEVTYLCLYVSSIDFSLKHMLEAKNKEEEELDIRWIKHSIIANKLRRIKLFTSIIFPKMTLILKFWRSLVPTNYRTAENQKNMN